MAKRVRVQFGFLPINRVGYLNPCYECGEETTSYIRPIPQGERVLAVCPSCKEKTFVVPKKYREARKLSEIARGVVRSPKHKKVTNPTLIAEVRRLRSEGLSIAECAKALGVSYGTAQAISASCSPPVRRGRKSKDGYGKSKSMQVFESFALAETVSE
jgi:hypothetical protein